MEVLGLPVGGAMGPTLCAGTTGKRSAAQPGAPLALGLPTWPWRAPRGERQGLHNHDFWEISQESPRTSQKAS